MRVDIRSRDAAIDDALISSIQWQIRLKLGSLATRVCHMTVLLSNTLGSRGIRCRLLARVSPRSRLRFETTHPDLDVAVEWAVEQTHRVLATNGLRGENEEPSYWDGR